MFSMSIGGHEWKPPGTVLVSIPCSNKDSVYQSARRLVHVVQDLGLKKQLYLEAQGSDDPMLTVLTTQFSNIQGG